MMISCHIISYHNMLSSSSFYRAHIQTAARAHQTEISRYLVMFVCVDSNDNHRPQYLNYDLLLYTVSRVPSTGSGCTRRTMRTTLRHIGSTAIRPVTAGGTPGNRMRMSSVFATETTKVSATNRAVEITATCAKRARVSSKYAVVPSILFDFTAVCFQQASAF